MKTIFQILIVASLLFSSNFITAQTFEGTEESSDITGFDTRSIQENFLLNQETNASVANTTTVDNSIFIAQIGDNNNLITATKSQESEIAIIQNGDDNLAVIDLNSTKLKETVIQNGDSNVFFDYSPFQSEIRNTTVNQTGNNQNLTIFGSNSLSEKIKISMQGQDQSIIIRNF